MAQILDGKSEAQRLTSFLIEQTREFVHATSTTPRLAIVLIGHNIASEIYVGRKRLKAQEIGISTDLYRLGPEVSQSEAEELLDKLNEDASVHGILIQLPLPSHLDQTALLHRVSPSKDVDGLTTSNIGLFVAGAPRFTPCTALACLHLIHMWNKNLQGMEAVVIGRSLLVGLPVAGLLMRGDATVTQCHSKTRDLPGCTRRADILVVAVGHPKLVKETWVKEGACVIDVGINGRGRMELVGDVDFEAVSRKAGAISPVPGGVGPLTIMYLMRNVLQAAGLPLGREM